MLHTALPFAPPQLTDAHRVKRCVEAGNAMGNDLAFANIYLLREKYKTQLAIEDDMLYRYFAGHTRLQGYAFPCGTGDVLRALGRIEIDALLHQRPLQFCLLTEQEAMLLQEWRPGQFEFLCNPGNADYVYERTSLAELPGTAYHRKRNHIARFNKMHPHWCFCALSPDRAADAYHVATQWYQATDDDSPALLHELHAIETALNLQDELGLIGGIIYDNGQPVAMSLASLISPLVADIHYEKCIPTYRDAYPVINQEMARRLQSTYINREEDLNQPGLRQAKLSYRPAILLKKYTAVPLSAPC